MVDREGIMVKEGGRYKSWKKRFFVLSGPLLFYFKQPLDFYGDALPIAQGVIYLPPYTKCEVVDQYKKTKNCFSLTVSKGVRTFYMDAPSAEERKAWIDSILHNAHHCQDAWAQAFECFTYVVGKSRSGKTSLLRRYTQNVFIDGDSSSIADATHRTVLHDGIAVVSHFVDAFDKDPSALEILSSMRDRYEKACAITVQGPDAFGAEQARSPKERQILDELLTQDSKDQLENPLFSPSASRDSLSDDVFNICWSAILFVVDVTDASSWMYVQRVAADVLRASIVNDAKIPMFIVGTKCDLEDCRVVDTFAIIAFCERELGGRVPYLELSSRTGKNVDVALSLFADMMSRSGFARAVPRSETQDESAEPMSDED